MNGIPWLLSRIYAKKQRALWNEISTLLRRVYLHWWQETLIILTVHRRSGEVGLLWMEWRPGSLGLLREWVGGSRISWASLYMV